MRRFEREFSVICLGLTGAEVQLELKQDGSSMYKNFAALRNCSNKTILPGKPWTPPPKYRRTEMAYDLNAFKKSRKVYERDGHGAGRDEAIERLENLLSEYIAKSNSLYGRLWMDIEIDLKTWWAYNSHHLLDYILEMKEHGKTPQNRE